MSAHPAEPEVWVVVCANDKPHPRLGIDPGGPIVHETYTKDATREGAMKRAATMERYGACRIARLVFDNQPEAGGPGTTHTPTKESQQ